MSGVLIIKLLVFPVYLPRWMKRIAQVLSGTYIGCSIGFDSLRNIHRVLLPAAIIVTAYIINALLIGRILARRFHIPFKEAMLMMSPAGASDMALISADIGVQSPTLVVVQILRLLIASSLMPQLCYQIARLLDLFL